MTELKKRGDFNVIGFRGGLIANRRHLKLEENREVNLITQNAILKVQETHKISDLYRVIGEFPDGESEEELRKKPEIEIAWELLGGGARR